MGGARRLFDTESLVLNQQNDSSKVGDIMSYLESELSKLEQKKGLTNQNQADLESDFIIAVNGVDCNAIKGYDTEVKKDDTITLLPVVHGGMAKNYDILCDHG